MLFKPGKIMPEAFMRQLQQAGDINQEDLPALVVVVGEEAYYRDKVRKFLLNKIFADVPEENRDINVFEEKSDLQQLETTINSFPFFSGRQVVIIKDKELLGGSAGNDRMDRLMKILWDIPYFSTVILQTEKMDGRQKFTKDLKKKAVYVDCSAIDQRYLRRWLDDMAAYKGARFTPQASGRIMEYMSIVDKVPLGLLAGEIEKIQLYAGARKEWTLDDVEQMFSALPEIGVFALNNAVMSRDSVKTLRLLGEEKKRKTYLPLIVAKLSATIRNVLCVKEGQRMGMSQRKIAELMHKSPYVVGMWARDAEKFTEEKLEKLLLDLSHLVEEISLGGRQYDRLEEILLAFIAF